MRLDQLCLGNVYPIQIHGFISFLFWIQDDSILLDDHSLKYTLVRYSQSGLNREFKIPDDIRWYDLCKKVTRNLWYFDQMGNILLYFACKTLKFISQNNALLAFQKKPTKISYMIVYLLICLICPNPSVRGLITCFRLFAVVLVVLSGQNI